MGDMESAWTWLFADAAKQISQPRRVLADLHSIVNRYDRILGHVELEHAGLYRLRPQAARTSERANRRVADDDDCVRGDGRNDYTRGGRHLPADETRCTLGPHEPRR